MVTGNSIIGPRSSIEVVTDMPSSYWLNEFFVKVGKWYDWMQFTGLHDKNGKEIYEGDIIKNTYNGIKYEMVWKGSGFIGDERIKGMKRRADGHIRLTEAEAEFGFEVIGNIYENPELLKS